MGFELPSIPEAISDISHLQFFARHAVEGTLTGLHRSGLFGSSIEFAEHKPYAPGDDLKHIDWKVLARSDRYTLKRFEDETNLRAYLVIDSSASMNFGTIGHTKGAYATVLGASLAYLLMQQQDLVGLLRFGGEEPAYLPPRGQSSHFQVVADFLLTGKAEGSGKLTDALSFLRERIHRKGVVIVISDFLTGTEELEAMAKVNHAQGNETHWFHLLDPAEIDFPFKDWARFRGLEGEEEIETRAGEAARSYRREITRWVDSLRDIALAHVVRYRLVRTDEALPVVLASVLS